MIFDKRFDISLWIVLASSIGSRKDIASLVYNIPMELLELINIQLKEYGKNSDNIDYSWKKFRKAKRDCDGNTYLYCIEINSEEIDIKLNKWSITGNKTEERMRLSLSAISQEDLSNINVNSSIYVGCFSSNKSQVLNNTVLAIGREKQYKLMYDTPFGFVVCRDDDSKLFWIINIKNMPTNIDLFDLKDMDSVNKLVRKRKK